MCATVASLRRRSVWGDGPEHWQRPQGAAGLPPAKGGCRRVGAHNGDLRLEDRAGAPLQERLGPAEQGPERLDTRIRARRRQAHQGMERVNGAAPTLGGLVAAVPIANRGEPAGELACRLELPGTLGLRRGRTTAVPPQRRRPPCGRPCSRKRSRGARRVSRSFPGSAASRQKGRLESSP